MTNAEIIMNQSIELMEQGIIKGTGRMFEAVITDAEGNEEKRMIEEPEAKMFMTTAHFFTFDQVEKIA